MRDDGFVIELILVAVLILLNGFFAMSELALVSARKARLQSLAANGDRRAKVALELSNDPGRFLSTVQIGITLIGILAGAFSGATIAERRALSSGSRAGQTPSSKTAASATSTGWFSRKAWPGCPRWIGKLSPCTRRS